MNIPGHFSKSLETFFGLKLLKFFDADSDPESRIFLARDPGWKTSDPGSGKNIPDPRHWIFYRQTERRKTKIEGREVSIFDIFSHII
jgi:hypothetical protein